MAAEAVQSQVAPDEQVQDSIATKKDSTKKDTTKWLRKTKLCVYSVQGSCRLGSKCSFAHSVGEVQQAPNLHKTQICPAFEKGSCSNENCTFAHGQEELRLSPNYKNKMCKWFGKGQCRNGDECDFAHGSEQLRQQPTATLAPPPGLSLAEDTQPKTVLSLAGGLLEDEPKQPASLEKQVEGMSAQISALQWKMDQMALRTQVTGMKQFLGQLSEQCAMLESQLSQPAPTQLVTPAPWNRNNTEEPWEQWMKTKLKTKLKSNGASFQPSGLSSQAQPFVPNFGMQQTFGSYDGYGCGVGWNSDESTDIGSGAEAGGFASD